MCFSVAPAKKNWVSELRLLFYDLRVFGNLLDFSDYSVEPGLGTSVFKNGQNPYLQCKGIYD